ncbi:hypothetical protein [Nocardiopsis synnemataformans]|uniref:hypothetical protein n=1 Tax=Nocardiopsis synnemataformans TaxID=61305 RepID=UPI003EBD0F35
MTAYTLPDSRAAVTNALRGLLADRPEPFVQGVTVGTRRWVADHSPESPGRLPYVLVASDGATPVHWPAAVRDLVRITAWGETEDDAWDLAGLCLGLLADHRDRVLRGLRPAGSLLRATDRDTQTPMCSGLLNATLRPVPAA